MWYLFDHGYYLYYSMQTNVYIVNFIDTYLYIIIFIIFTRFLLFRDWSLITGRGVLQNGKIAGPKLFAPPPQDRVKLFAPPPLLKIGNFSRPPYNMAKTSSYYVKTTPKLFVPPPSAWLKLYPPPLFVGVKLHVPAPPTVL